MTPRWIKQSGPLTSALQRLGECLGVPREAAEINQVLRALEDSSDPLLADAIGVMAMAGKQLEMRLATTRLSPRDAWAMNSDGFLVLLDLEDGQWLLLKFKVAWRIEALKLVTTDGVTVCVPVQLTFAQLKKYWRGQSTLSALLAQSTTAGISSPTGETPTSAHGNHRNEHDAHAGGHGHGDAHGHGHMSPLRRLWSLLKLELRDLSTLILFALVAGVLGLATPLAVESLVNTVAWGTYLQPLFVLSFLLFGFLSFAGLLKLLQQIIVEVLQRRLLVRIIGDLAHRFPMVKRSALESEHPAELANRFFDIMTIQKSTASLVLDGISIVLQTSIGLILLAFYHPFLLGFDIVLLVMMTVFTYLLGRNGVRTAIDESIVKYQLAHWLQDVISFPTAFRLHGGSGYAIERANRFTVAYLMERQDHFRVLVRQSAFSLILLAVASTALLGVGGWLVVRGELTLGQLVASELVVTAIVGAFAKIGKSLESFYDLCAAVDKVGHLLDLPYDTPALDMSTEGIPPRIRWQNLPVDISGHPAGEVVTIEPGSRVAVSGPSGSGKSRLLATLAGLHQPTHGFAEIAGFDSRDASRVSHGNLLALTKQPEIFCGPLLENVRLGRSWLTIADVRNALERVGLWEDVLKLPSGMDSQLQTGGYPLTYAQSVRLALARAIAAAPSVLLIDGTLDMLDPDARFKLWDALRQVSTEMTIVIATHDSNIADSCDRTLRCTMNSAHAQDSESPAHG